MLFLHTESAPISPSAKVNITEEEKIAYKVSLWSIGLNVVLVLIKMFAGIFAHSSAMISDAVHSASDILSTVVVIAGVNISNKQADEDHQYGHERMESIAALFLSGMLILTSLMIGYSGIEKIFFGRQELIIPGKMALIAAMISIILKEYMFWFTMKAAKQIHSDALRADAWHHRSDSLSSIGSLLGIGAAILGFPIFDPVASLLICLMIVKTAYDIGKDAVNKLIDTSCEQEIITELEKIILSQPGVLAIDSLKTRMFGSKFYVDVEISADGNLSLYASHDIAKKVHDTIEEMFPTAKHCMVHVNPYEPNEK